MGKNGEEKPALSGAGVLPRFLLRKKQETGTDPQSPVPLLLRKDAAPQGALEESICLQEF